MPKARNQQTEQAIRSAAWRLFFDRGFAATSYTDLAEASGVSRSLVQRYVPKKELLVGWCVAEIRRAATEVCDEAYPQRLGPLERLYLRGQASIAAYFACEGIGRLMLDVLSSRELTQQTIVEGFRWTVEHTLPDRPELHDIDWPDEIVMATGGLYELVYVYLLKGHTPDVAAVTLPSVQTFGRVLACQSPQRGWRPTRLPPTSCKILPSERSGASPGNASTAPRMLRFGVVSRVPLGIH
ncbi:MAG: TetR/AcrR family transcriptional regulator [Atopobiaceae bacterium]|nr:TetR/AcrR family transcriptional regulator [Atopobiaceae bacterium]